MTRHDLSELPVIENAVVIALIAYEIDDIAVNELPEVINWLGAVIKIKLTYRLAEFAKEENSWSKFLSLPSYALLLFFGFGMKYFFALKVRVFIFILARHLNFIVGATVAFR